MALELSSTAWSAWQEPLQELWITVDTTLQFYSACEFDPVVRRILLESDCCPQHVFGDLTERVGEVVVERMRRTVSTCVARADNVKASKKSAAQKKLKIAVLNDRCMKKLIKLGMDAIAADRARPLRMCHCYIHDRMCPVLPPDLGCMSRPWWQRYGWPGVRAMTT